MDFTYYAVVIAGVMFFDMNGINSVIEFYTGNISNLLLLIGYVCVAYAFITMDNYRKKDKYAKNHHT